LGEKIHKKFVLKNISNFALDFKLLSLAHGIKNSDGKEAILFDPCEGKILASEELEIDVFFRPDRVS
jgi:hypothetical protein